MIYSIAHNRFEHKDVNPGKLAIAGSDREITWQEFQKEVLAFNELIKDLKVPEGHPVLIYGHKEVAFIIAIAACMMNKIPYVPIDVATPIERVRKIAVTTQSQVLINLSNSKPEELEIPVVIQDLTKLIQTRDPDYSKGLILNEGDPVQYIMFTSGSTGEPKGVQITKQAILSFSNWVNTAFDLKDDEVYMNQASFGFDVSLFELYAFLSRGSSIVLNTADGIKSPDEFIERIKMYNCSVWVSTPALAYMYLTDPRFNQAYLSKLNTFLFCGDVLPKRTVQLLLERFPGSRVLNTYGPTEATVACTLVEVTTNILEKYKEVPIGYPKNTSELLIDNESENPEEVGALILIGDHVSIGYYNIPELNSQKFFTHNGKRAFRTGDYGYYKDGMLFFSGRRDEQIKLHGYRVELGDINTQIAKHPKVKAAITIPLKSGEIVKKLISFVQLKDHALDKATAKADIIATIKNLLPEYMVPGDFLFVHEFPVNNSFKIDKHKLIEMYMATA